VEPLAIAAAANGAKSAQEDLKAIKEGVRAINEQKDRWRETQSEVNATSAGRAGMGSPGGGNEPTDSESSDRQTVAPTTASDPIQVLIGRESMNRTHDQDDSDAELSADASRRLQAATEAQGNAGLSNILRRAADTNDGITGNLEGGSGRFATSPASRAVRGRVRPAAALVAIVGIGLALWAWAVGASPLAGGPAAAVSTAVASLESSMMTAAPSPGLSTAVVSTPASNPRTGSVAGGSMSPSTPPPKPTKAPPRTADPNAGAFASVLRAGADDIAALADDVDKALSIGDFDSAGALGQQIGTRAAMDRDWLKSQAPESCWEKAWGDAVAGYTAIETGADAIGKAAGAADEKAVGDALIAIRGAVDALVAGATAATKAC